MKDYKIIFLVSSFLFFISCKEEIKKEEQKLSSKKEKLVVNFNADSAFAYVQKQVDFGPRVPNTPEHDSCGKWLEKKLAKFTDKVYTQSDAVEAFDGTKLNFTNIIGSFNPERRQRVALMAHWDTRPFADQDDQDTKKPILGASDGASGVGILLEIARQFSQMDVKLGVDIILFDVEDYGSPSWSYSSKANTYCLGSQYWAKNPHVANYNAQYGILLDMVGAKGAMFCMEGYSMQFAPSIMRGVWNQGVELGYSNYFCFDKVQPITDDHYYVNTLLGIPTIDIIQFDPSTTSYFGQYWHTHDDNMGVIDKKTLKAVGHTVINYISN